MNYRMGIQRENIGSSDLNTVYQGMLIEHLVGQELLAQRYDALSTLNFWVRKKIASTAEVAYILQHEGNLIPIAIKSGKEGRLKSLHLFMEQSPHELAIRFYAGEFSERTVTTNNEKTYRLLNIPYYLISQIERYIEWGDFGNDRPVSE